MTSHLADRSVASPGQLLESRANRTLLRFLTCGSVDDGKSTLIGRLLYDDQLAALEADSKRFGSADGVPDFALLLDGLAAEREQGITIDVAYRFFSTDKRQFIVADTPGHEQYTRNMVTGASTADAAVILVDARKGVLTQTRRHTYLVALLGIRHVALTINKLDLVDYSRAIADRIEQEYRAFAASVDLTDVVCIPMSAKLGDNVTRPSKSMPWYRGPALIDWLETVEPSSDAKTGPLRLPVQWVNRPDQHFRGFSGPIVGGAVGVGDRVRVLPSAKEHRGAHRYARRRPRARRRRTIDHDRSERRDRHQPRGFDLRHGRAGRSCRPVRGNHRLDERRGDVAGPALPAQDRDQDRRGDGGDAEVQDQRQLPRAPGGQDAASE